MRRSIATPHSGIRAMRSARKTLCCLAGLAGFSAQAELVHRWSFGESGAAAPAGTELIDSVSAAVATVRGHGSALEDGALTIPGTTTGNSPAESISGYLDLPNGIISSKTELSIEIWATPLGTGAWSRLFDFGRVAGTGSGGGAPGEVIDLEGVFPGPTAPFDDLTMSFSRENDVNLQRLRAIHDGDDDPLDIALPTTLGTRYHYVCIFEDGVGSFAATGGRVSWYCDGVVAASRDVDFRLSEFRDVNNWLGRSAFTADRNAHAAYHELRLYDHPLSPGEIAANHAAGPEELGGPPEPPAPAPFPVHRWTFDSAPGPAPSGSEFIDSATGEIATLRGHGASLSGTELILSPNPTTGNESVDDISAYLDLGNGLISSRPEITVEAWVTPLSSNNWQRVFDFGNASATHGPGALAGEIIDDGSAPGGFQANDNLLLSMNVAGTLGEHRLEARLDGGTAGSVDTDLSSVTEAGTEYHFVLTVEDGAGSFGSSGSRVRWYRDSVPQSSLDLGFRLTELDDVNNWIGRSLWSADRNSHMAINELRIYDRAISAREVESSFDATADATFPPPVAAADSATIHPGGKVLIDVLANDTGSPLPASVELVTPPATGTARVRDSGEILYTHDGSDSPEVTFAYRTTGLGGVSSPGAVTVTVSDQLRIPSPEFNVPASPPPTEIALVDAFPGVTFDNALAFASPPGDGRRLFVCEIGGVLKVIPDTTAASPASSVVLDLNAVISDPPRDPSESIQPGANGESGLLGVAFHPDFATNGHFYVFYSVVRSGTTGFFQRVSRFTIPAEQIDAPAPAADPASELILIDQFDRGPNHQGGDMHFGPDGYLYISVGDEQNPNDVYLNSQRIDKNLFAGLLRIDVDKLPGNPEPNAHAAVPTDDGIARFSIPADNPWIGATEFLGQPVDPGQVRTEFYAVGLRSPWRFWIDPDTGDIWLADVGQDRYEELNLIEKGGNYGWVFREGAHDIDTHREGWPDKPENFNSTAIDPIYE